MSSISEFARAYLDLETTLFDDMTLDRFTWEGAEWKGQVDLLNRKETLSIGGYENETDIVLHARTGQFSSGRPKTGHAITWKGTRYRVMTVTGSEDDNEEAYELMIWP